MKKLGLILIVFVLMMSGCKTNEKKPPVTIIELNAKKADMSGYEGFTTTDHEFLQVTLRESNRIFAEKGSAILYLGFPTCPWCIEAIPVMNNVAKELGLKVYYVDVSSKEENEQSDYDTMISNVSEKLTKEDGTPRLYVPQVFVISEGQIVGDHLSTVDSHNAHERLMNDKEKEQLAKIYMNMFGKLK